MYLVTMDREIEWRHYTLSIQLYTVKHYSDDEQTALILTSGKSNSSTMETHTEAWCPTMKEILPSLFTVRVCVSVCLTETHTLTRTVKRDGKSVCLSVTSRSCTKMAKSSIAQTNPYDSPETPVFWRQNLGEIPSRPPLTGAPNRGGGRFKSAIFDQYLAISQKRCKIGTQLLWKANRNSYALYRMALFSMILGDP